MEIGLSMENCQELCALCKINLIFLEMLSSAGSELWVVFTLLVFLEAAVYSLYCDADILCIRSCN